jgi:hypothetical protein
MEEDIDLSRLERQSWMVSALLGGLIGAAILGSIAWQLFTNAGTWAHGPAALAVSIMLFLVIGFFTTIAVLVLGPLLAFRRTGPVVAELEGLRLVRLGRLVPWGDIEHVNVVPAARPTELILRVRGEADRVLYLGTAAPEAFAEIERRRARFPPQVHRYR